MRRPGEFRDRGEVVDPCLLRANKYLPAWHQFISLAQRSKPRIVGFLFIANRCRIQSRAAMRAETLHTDVSAIGSLSIFCRFAGQEHERAWTSDNYRSQWSAAHYLAVRAVANGRRFGIGFGLERHIAAVTASINFHDRFPGTPQIGMDDSWFPHRADSSATGQQALCHLSTAQSIPGGSKPWVRARRASLALLPQRPREIRTGADCCDHDGDRRLCSPDPDPALRPGGRYLRAGLGASAVRKIAN
jgi:hypothetical protein